MGTNKVGILNTDLTLNEFVELHPQYNFDNEHNVLGNRNGSWAFVFFDDEGKIHLPMEQHVSEEMLFELLLRYGGEFYQSEYDNEPTKTFVAQAELDEMVKKSVDKLLKGSDVAFPYMMLDRMRSDCEYYLGYGNRQAKRLWGKEERKHIAYMKEIWNRFPENGKPEWLPYEKILDYEKQMVGYYPSVAIELEDKYVDDEYGTTTYYFIAPKEMLEGKYPEAESMEISIEFPTDRPEAREATVMFSPTKYVVEEQCYMDYDWFRVDMPYEKIERLMVLAEKSLVDKTVEKIISDATKTCENMNISDDNIKENMYYGK